MTKVNNSAEKSAVEIIFKPTRGLTPNARNARTHSERQIQKIANSIKKFQFLNPVIIDAKGEIIAGHGRVLGAQKLGLESVPCIVADHLTDAEKRAYMLADNRIAEEAGWDDDLLKVELGELFDLGFDLSFTGFDVDEVDGFVRANRGDSEIDDAVPDAPVTPVSQLGDVWICGDHRVMCGDSTDLEQINLLMIGAKADMVFTDPPYGVSYASKNAYLNTISPGNRIQKEIKNDHMDLDKTQNFIYQSFVVIKSILAKRSSYYITAPQGGDLMMMMMMMMQKAEIPLRHCLIWVKNNHVLGRTDYNYKHEPILYGWVDVHDFYGEGDHKFSTWEIDKPLKNDLHPTMKPVALVENAILNSSKKSQIITDIFGGSGTTMIAAEKTGRHSRLMELDPSYVDVIVRRWQEFTGKKATRESDGVLFDSLILAQEAA